MATLSTIHYWEHGAAPHKIYHSFNVTPKGSTVDVSVKQGDMTNGYAANGARFDWTMKLQRYVDGAWKTIGTREGYVVYGSDSHRTFTNIAKTGKKLRVRLTVTGEGSFNSDTWTY